MSSNPESAFDWGYIGHAFARVGRATVPLYGPRGQRVPVHGGCGVVVSLDEHLFILTAAHVHLGLEENERGQAFAAFDGGLVPIRGRTYRSEPDADREDEADAAVIHLAVDDEVVRLRPAAISLDADCVYEGPQIGEPCALRGYPHRDAARVRGGTVTAKWHTWAGYAAQTEAIDVVSKRSVKQLAMKMPLDDLRDPTGARVRSVSPAGCSGSGLWTLPLDGEAKLAGIFTEVRSQHFVATSIIAHVGLIVRFAPEALDWDGPSL